MRISVSDLESFRYWKANEDLGLGFLITRLRHEDPPTPAMEAGRAFAKMFERARAGNVDEVTVDGWTFDFSALNQTIALPEVRELKAEEVFQTPSGPVTLVGMVDSLDGTTVRDQKLTERWDAERYLDSLQWRAYLVMFKAQRFVYDVFQGRYDDKRVTIYGYEAMPFFAYPKMRADVQQAVEELADIIATHLPERKAA